MPARELPTCLVFLSLIYNDCGGDGVLVPPDSGSASIKFRLLGPVRADSATGPIEVAGATARAVLALLLVRGQLGASTDEIITTVWGTPGGATRDSVYHYVSALRRSLIVTGTMIEGRDSRYRLITDPDSVDWHWFRRLVTQARAASDRRDAASAATTLRQALALWTGPPLADIGERLAQIRRDMAEQRRAAIEALAAIEFGLGRFDDVVSLLRDEVAAGPVRERMAALMIDALTALGRRDDAGEIYRMARTRLASEQGLEPGDQLEAAHRRALEGTAPAAASATFSGAPISGLPRLDPHFTGRETELATLTAALVAGGRPLCAIYGMGGSGKTALAVRAAHSLTEVFADGAIFLDLHGFTEQRASLPAAEALDRLLRRMRVDGGSIPADFDERGALFRDLVTGRRMLFVLDNAYDAAQVSPLLPDADGCAVIVSSRRRLAALDDAIALPLQMLAEAEAAELFRSVAGQRRVRIEPGSGPTLARVIERCGRLPLAVRIAAARYREPSQRSLADLAEKLSDEGERLTELDDGDRSVAASFRVSLNDLTAGLKRTFGLLAIDPGADFDVLAVAALAELPPNQATRDLAQLADRHLIAEHAPGRYCFHDLIGVFARQYALEALSDDDRDAATRRLADYLLRAADAADSLITPHRYRVPLQLLDRTAVLPSLGDYDEAFAWLSAEQGNLTDTCLAACAAGLDAPGWQLAYTLRGFYFLTKSWQPWITTYEAAQGAAQRCGDLRAEALIVNNLGLAHLERGRRDLARACYQQALELFAAAKDPVGENTARANIAWLLLSGGKFAEFLTQVRSVLDFYVEQGNERSAAITQRGIGLAESELGMVEESVADLRRALEVFTRLELRLDIAMTWNRLGETYQRAGDDRRAADSFAEALAASGQSGSDYETARAHYRLGQLEVRAGDRDSARDHLTQALDRFRELRVPLAAAARRELEDLDTYR
jgi:DNA-binding SARP family transcriptional activator